MAKVNFCLPCIGFGFVQFSFFCLFVFLKYLKALGVCVCACVCIRTQHEIYLLRFLGIQYSIVIYRYSVKQQSSRINASCKTERF